MRKITAFLAALVIVLCSFANAFAANSGKLEVADVNGKAGDQVNVTITLSNNPGIISARVFIQYDTKSLKLVDVKNGNIFSDSSATFGNNLSADPYCLLWEDALSKTNITKNGTLATLKFEILSSASGKSQIKIDIDENSTFDINLNNVSMTLSDGSVTVTQKTTQEQTTKTTTAATTKEKTTASTTKQASKTTEKTTQKSDSKTKVNTTGATPKTEIKTEVPTTGQADKQTTVSKQKGSEKAVSDKTNGSAAAPTDAQTDGKTTTALSADNTAEENNSSSVSQTESVNEANSGRKLSKNALIVICVVLAIAVAAIVIALVLSMKKKNK